MSNRKNTLYDKTFGEERALYGASDLRLVRCAFDGPEDGESALKEAAHITAVQCYCNLRYPFWHCSDLRLDGCELTSLCRAALWYADDVAIADSKLHGIKALRECRDVALRECSIISPEFGWSTRGLRMAHCDAEGEYFLLRAEDVTATELRLHGKYSFQYVQNATLDHCTLDTKDAFWHARNVTVRDSVIKGEYLAWYADGLTLERCRISGTQPFCYCKNLRLIDCELTEADLCFEKSDVQATLTAPVVSVKNPRSGRIVAPAVGELIMDDPAAKGEVVVTG